MPKTLERTLKNFWQPFLVKRTGRKTAFELGWQLFGRKAVDQKFFSVSGMGFGQQPVDIWHFSFCLQPLSDCNTAAPDNFAP
jgi:hypothetical protein